jgi:nucleoid-associated protein YejK
VHAFRLRDLGVRMILRETFPSSLEMAEQALLRLGFSASATASALSLFKRHDEEMLDAQYAVQHDEAKLIQTSKEAAEQLRELFESDPAARVGRRRAPVSSNAS